jgi:hypothetical protein
MSVVGIVEIEKPLKKIESKNVYFVKRNKRMQL